MRKCKNSEATFWRTASPNPETSCVEWIGCRWRGYGTVWYQGNRWRAHRLAWTFKRGSIPDGLFVLHKCNNRRCVNVDHLYLGTHLENVRDSLACGSFRTVFFKGNSYNALRWRGDRE